MNAVFEYNFTHDLARIVIHDATDLDATDFFATFVIKFEYVTSVTDKDILAWDSALFLCKLCVVNIEGDPDMPINEGSLCAKGAGLFGLTEANEHRLKKVLYRAPKSDKWEEKDWEWTLKRIARLVKDTRDKDFITHNAKGELVNRVESIGHYGSSNIGNEECWTLSVACRAMGLVHIDHQARV